MNSERFLIGLVIVLFSLVFHIMGIDTGKNILRKEAIKAGVAYWSVDQDGFTKFNWITE